MIGHLLPSATKFIVLAVMLGVGFGAGALLMQEVRAKNPLKYPVPQEVVTPGPIHEGATLTTRGVKCNTSGEPVTILGSDTYYVRLDAHGIVLASIPGVLNRTLVLAAHECLDRTFTRTLPDLEAGTWRIQGQDCVIPEGKWCRSWYSSSFVAE